MSLKIGVVSQKGGVGKSTIVRLLAVEYAREQWDVKIADLDPSQGTSFNWHSRRMGNDIGPEVSVEQFQRVDQVLKVADHYDLVVFDGAPHATLGTLQIAEVCDLVLLPTGISLDDLEPTIMLAHELRKNGIDPKKIALILSRVGDSSGELSEAQEYITQAGYNLINSSLPERTAYRRASDLGRAPTETTFPTLNKKAKEVLRGITNLINKLNKESENDDRKTAA